MENPIIMIGGMHGDEPLGVSLAEMTLDWLRQEKPSSSPWILIPCINPDGYWAATRVNGRGVDLNRNFPASDWQPEAKAPRYFPGVHSGSEKEVQALVQLIKSAQPRVIIHFHSWRPCVVCTGEPAMAVARALAESAQYELKADIGYETPGSLSRFGWHDHRIPVICVEEGDGTDADQCWRNFGPGIKSILTN